MTSFDLFIVGMIFGICFVIIVVWALIKCAGPKTQSEEKRYSGRIVVNTRDPHAETVRMELDVSFQEFAERKDVVLQIVRED